MAYTDPPDEVDDSKAPSDGDVDAPDACAFEDEVSDGIEHHHRCQEEDAKADKPSVGGRTRQDNGADFFGNRTEGVAGCDNGSPLDLGRRFVLLWHA